jgi:SulP family sulfate permease
LLVYSIEGEMFFGASPDLEKLLEQIESDLTPNSRVIVLRLRYARNPDSVCLNLVKQFVIEMKSRGIVVLLAGVRSDMLKILRNLGIAELVGEENLFREEPKLWTSTFEAIQRAYAILGDHRCDHCPQRKGSGDEPGEDAAWHFSI